MMLDLIMIVGPTATGKTKLSIALAKEFNGEIINGDSMQFYEGLNIGTAKIKNKEDVTHHLLDILSPTESFSVAEYQRLVREKISEIKSRDKLPIIVGGSGLYLNSIYYDYQFLGNVRKDITTETYKELTTEELAKILIEEKPLLAKKCDLSNRRRVLRALEKEDKDIQTTLFPFYQNAQVIGLNIERDLLYQRIDKRVDEMFEEGLIQEVKNLYLKGINSQAISAIGYKELYDYFNGKTTLEEAKNLIKRNSRRYAKRQLTWFNNKLKVNWFNVDPTNFMKTIEEVKKMIKKEVV